MVPRRPQVSVIRGAVLYGLNPRSISSRIAKKTYGINTLTTFDLDRHPEEKKVVIEGEDFCEDVFDAFVRKGRVFWGNFKATRWDAMRFTQRFIARLGQDRRL